MIQNGCSVDVVESFAKESNGKQSSELKPFSIVNNSFKKIVITRNELMPWYDENGIYYILLVDFFCFDMRRF